MRMKDKVTVITGGASGLGTEIAIYFAENGGTVVVADINSKAIDEVVATIKGKGGEAFGVTADVTVAKDMERLFNSCEEQYGRLDALFNGAGIAAVGNVVDLPEETWDRVMNVNLKGTFLACKYAIPLMIKSGGGAILNAGSVTTFSGDSLSCVYPASKSALLTFTKNTALQFVKQNIRANTICPGHCWTPIVAALYEKDQELKDKLLAKYPMGRFAQPREIAQAALFLLSDESSFVTGTELIVDGGFLAK
ncbi:MAG: glucose 1-dehydrogenase [Deltaproteobacteria bacterium]|jgi:NAD(P)-dependent dehydrogenase (short-subunit alcohol dehydrogenase family)|nr:glucose 1-dehydrogenase [Deltaproteobacteria bacterium]